MRVRKGHVISALCGLALFLALVFGRAPHYASAASFIAIASGQAHTCALTSSGGGVQCWGWNVNGQLGIGTTTSPYDQSSVPLTVCASGSWNGTSCGGGSAYTGVYGVWAGAAADDTCATVIFYILECWGSNYYGQVGNGTSGNPVLNPAVVACAGNSSYCNSTYHFLAGITAVATGLTHTCALDQGGYVWCWGNNGSGALGDGTTASRATANRVCASGSGQDCPNGTLLSGVTAIAAGDYFSCALTTTGGVTCWGSNSSGQLGDGTTTNRLLPVDASGLTSGAAQLTIGEAHTCAILSSGGVKCWGFNADGELGDGTQTSRPTPVSVCATGSGGSCIPLAGVSKFTAGSGHTCVITTTAPAVSCWGSQYFGQLGNSVQSLTNALHPVSWMTPSWGQPQPTALSAGGLHTCAIISTYVECWGWNLFGQVGNGTTNDTATWVTQDADGDGCTDGQELGPNHVYGGQRDPTNFWDFFDTPNDSRTTLSVALSATAGPGSTITVASTAGFPVPTSSIYPTLLIDSGTTSNEMISYDALNSTNSTFTIHARGLNGTSPVNHAASATVISNWRDGYVTNEDVNRVVARYGSSGNPNTDPLAPPPPAPAYSPAYDRTYVGPNPWNLGPPAGQITAATILAVQHEVGDHCQPNPSP